MSNPSVFELAKTEIDNSIICIEDNIGEAIHLHIGSFRIDVSIKEFFEITKKLENVLDFLLKEIKVNISEYNPYFLLNFSENWLNVLKVEKKTIKISELNVRYINKEKGTNNYRLIDSPFYKYYLGEDIDLEKYSNMTDILQTNKERADFIYDKVLSKEPSAADYAIVIDENNYILDGEEKACSLLKIFGEGHLVDTKVIVLKNKSNFGRRLKDKKW